MLDGFHVLTITHREAPIDMLGEMTPRTDSAGLLLRQLRDDMGWQEMLYLGTCNRILFIYYRSGRGPVDQSLELVQKLLPDSSPKHQESMAKAFRNLHGSEAIQHVVEVASSLDSLVIGEREIIRQLREAYHQSKDWQLCGDHLRLLMRFTVETAKDVYTTTGIGEKALSVVALAFQQLQKTGLDKKARIVMIGAGQTNALAAKFLDKYGYRNVTVFNRTLEKAQAIAEYLDGTAKPLAELTEHTEGFDALIVCTGAKDPVVTRSKYKSLLAGETDQKIVVDLAVPNNVAAEVVEKFPMQYIQIEDLRSVAEQNRAFREEESLKAKEMIAGSLYQFRHMWHERQVERSLSSLPREVGEVKEKALTEVFEKEFNQLDPEAQDLVMRMMGYMEKKCIAIPMKTVKRIAMEAAQTRKG